MNSNPKVQSQAPTVIGDFKLTMESVQGAFFAASFAHKSLTAISISRAALFRIRLQIRCEQPLTRPEFMVPRRSHSSRSGMAVRAGWFLGLGDKKNILPDIVKAGDPVLHEPAKEVRAEEIKSERIQKIVDDMVMVMRKAPGVGLAAPQIGIPLRVCIFR